MRSLNYHGRRHIMRNENLSFYANITGISRMQNYVSSNNVAVTFVLGIDDIREQLLQCSFTQHIEHSVFACLIITHYIADVENLDWQEINLILVETAK